MGKVRIIGVNGEDIANIRSLLTRVIAEKDAELAKANERAAIAEAENAKIRGVLEFIASFDHQAGTVAKKALSQPLGRTALDEAIAEVTNELKEKNERYRWLLVEAAIAKYEEGREDGV